MVILKRVCTHTGCTTLVDKGKCERHATKENKDQDKHRGSAHSRGYTNKWSKARTSYLHSNPLCTTCSKQGLIKAASVVDHIVPHKGDMELFWEQSNWQPLCKAHHDEKTAKEDGGFGNGCK